MRKSYPAKAAVSIIIGDFGRWKFVTSALAVLVECGKMLEKGGYVIKSLNTINFRKSMHYNPFSYIRSEKDILKLVNTIIVNTKGDGDKSGEDFWVKAEKLYWENATRLTYMQEKYTALMQSLVRANKLDAKYAFNARQESASVEYVMQPYYAVADSLVNYNDKDIKRLYEERKSLYKQTPNRAIAYVSFPIVPSLGALKLCNHAVRSVSIWS